MDLYTIGIIGLAIAGAYILYSFLKGVFSASEELNKKPVAKNVVWPEGAKLSASKVKRTTLELNWPRVTAEAGILIEYVIYQDKEEIGRFPADELSCKVMKLKRGTAYNFSVIAEASTGKRSKALRCKISTQLGDIEKPLWPDDAVLQMEQKKTQIKISWPEASDNVGVKKYLLFLNNESAATLSASERSFTFPKPAPGNYELRVEAADTAGNISDNGPTLKFTIEEPILWKRGAALSFSIIDKSVVLLWPAPSGEPDKFRITKENNEQVILTADKNRFEWPLPEKGVYEISVEAADKSGNWSLPLKGQLIVEEQEKEIPAWPANAALVYDKEKQSVLWPAAIGKALIEKYELYLNDVLLAQLPAAVRSYLLEAPLKNGVFRFRIIAVGTTAIASAPLELLVLIDEDIDKPVNWRPDSKLRASAQEQGVLLEWNAAEGDVHRYCIYCERKVVATLPAASTSFVLNGLTAGSYNFEVQAISEAGEETTNGPAVYWEQKEFDTIKPQWPADAFLKAALSGRKVQLTWTAATDNVAVVRYVLYMNNAAMRELPAGADSFVTDSLNAGKYEFFIEAADAAGNVSAKGPSAAIEISEALAQPVWNNGSTIVTQFEQDTLIIKWPSAVADAERTIKAYKISRNSIPLLVLTALDNSYRMSNAKPGETYLITVEAQDSADAWSLPLQITVSIPVAAIPVNAPALNPAKAEPFEKTIEFIYSGNSPQQKGLIPETIDLKQVSVLKGKVTDRNGKPLSAVSVSVQFHPEFGNSSTDENGLFNMVVNGGGLLILNYEASGYLPVQRTVDTAWKEYHWLPDVAMLHREAVTGTVNFPTEKGIGIRANEVNDQDGKRCASVFFPATTSASVVLPDGKLKPSEKLNFRITEFTSGINGPQAMPGELPPTSGYTYALEITAEEAVAKVEGRDIVFDRDVFVYVNNFLNFPVGSPTPAGFFDSQRSSWVPGNDGLVVQIVSINNGLAELDINGKGIASSAEEMKKIDISDEERKYLSTVYTAGASIWRVPLRHFSIWDFNWPFGPPPDAEPGDSPEPDNPDTPDDPCTGNGSIIEYQTQVLGQELPLMGTPFNLCYRSNRVPGHLESRTLNIPLTKAKYPASLKAIEIQVEILGQKKAEQLQPSANLQYQFVWDMKDGFGRITHGIHPVKVRMGYIYDGVYKQPGSSGRSFAQTSGLPITGSRTRREVTLWSEWRGWTGIWDSRAMGLGGWTIDVHHFYDPRSKTLYLGNGTTKKISAAGQTITTVAGVNKRAGYGGDGGPATKAYFNTAQASEVHKDGTVYIADWGNCRVRKLLNDGTVITIAGTGEHGYSGDGGPALKAKFKNVHRVVAAKDGSFFVTDQDNHCIRRIDKDGIVSTFAGTGKPGFSGDGGEANKAELYYPRCLRLAPDGTLYFSDTNNHRIRKVTPDGIIVTIAGIDYPDYSGDGGPAVKAGLHTPQEIFITEDGKVYFADQGNNCIRCIHPDGMITTVAGKGTAGYSGDGGKATEAELNSPEGFAVTRDGIIYIADRNNHCIRMVSANGIISTIAGNGENDCAGDGSAAREASFMEPHAIALRLDGSIYVSDVDSHSIRKILAPQSTFKAGELSISSEDNEELFIFSPDGMHVRTLDAISGKEVYNMVYKDSLLQAIECEDGNKLNVLRDKNKLTIGGLRNETLQLTLNDQGFVGEMLYDGTGTFYFGYEKDGLMHSMQYPSQKHKAYKYDEQGRLIYAANSSTGALSLLRKQLENGYAVEAKHSMGWTKEFRMLKEGENAVRVNFVQGIQVSRMTTLDNGDEEILLADGTKISYQTLPVEMSSTTTKSGLRKIVTLPSGKQQITDEWDESIFKEEQQNYPVSVKNSVVAGEMISSVSYDAEKRVATVVLPGGVIQQTTFDEEGRILKIIRNGVEPIECVYDKSGRLNQVIQAERNIQVKFNAAGLPVQMTDSENRVAEMEYNAHNFTVAKQIGKTDKSGYAFDSFGLLNIATAPSGKRYHFKYNDAAGLMKMTGENGAKLNAEFAYDEFGQMSRMLRAEEEILSVKHDVLGRVSAEKSKRGTRNYLYSHMGKVTEIKSEEGTLRISYDGPLKVAEAWQGEWNTEVQFTYDANLRLVKTIVKKQELNITYDGFGRATGFNEAVYNYDAVSALSSGFKIGKAEKKITRNKFGEPEGILYSFDGKPLIQWTYLYDKAGRIKSIEEVKKGVKSVRSFVYDEGGNISEVCTNGDSVFYKYDKDGNRKVVLEENAETQLIYSGEFLLQCGNIKYNFSGSGFLRNTESDMGKNQYNYERFGNLIDAQLADGTKLEYIWDGLNRCIGWKKNGKIIRRVVYKDTLRPLAELDDTGELRALYVYSHQSPVPDFMISNGKKIVLAADINGSICLCFDANTGEVLHSCSYGTFGEVLHEEGTPIHVFGFAGGIFDENTGFTRFGLRDYHTQCARWNTPDPFLIGCSDFNMYTYCMNDPLNMIDRSGLAVTKIVGKVFELVRGRWKVVQKGEFDVNDIYKLLEEGFDFRPKEKSLGKHLMDDGSKTRKGSGWENHSPKKERLPEGDPRFPPPKQRSKKKQKYEEKYVDHGHNVESWEGGTYQNRVGHGGHILRGITGPLTFKHYTDGHGGLAEALGELGDFFNPLSLPNDLLDIADALRDDGCP